MEGGRHVKWIVRVVVVLAVLYGMLFGGMAMAMRQPPEQFSMIMKRMPGMLVWGALPARSMWLWARRGNLKEGDDAPDFTLPAQDKSGDVTLSSHRGKRPVVLVFGSYT